MRKLLCALVLFAAGLPVLANTYTATPGSKARQNISFTITDAIPKDSCEELSRSRFNHATTTPSTSGSFKIKIKPAAKSDALPTSLNVKRVIYDDADPAVKVSETGFGFGPIPLKNGKGKTKYPSGIGPANSIQAGYREAVQLCPLGADIPAGATIEIDMQLKFDK